MVNRAREQLISKETVSTSLIELLNWRAIHQFDKNAYTFLADRETETACITYGELEQKSRSIAALLQSMKTKGKRAILIYPPGLEFISAFFGCLYAEVIAVPAYLPQSNHSMSRLETILSDAQASVVLTTASSLKEIRDQFAQNSEFAALRWIATDDIATDLASDWQEPIFCNSTLAFLQYTSGSTETPKGVMVSHENLLHNLDLFNKCFDTHNNNSQSVIWLPPHHYLGLIAGILQPLYSGFPATLMSPEDFLQKPLRWLQAISRYQATISGGPNFAYDLCVRKVTPEQVASLDLSSWQIAFNATESTSVETLERFAATFKHCGFRSNAFYPCNVTPATLSVSGDLQKNAPVIKTFQTSSTLEAILAADLEDQHMLLESYLRAQVSQILKVAPSRLEIQQPLNTMGFDSLMAVELRNVIETNLGVALPMVSLLQGTSVAQLVTEVSKKLTKTPTTSATLVPLPETSNDRALSYGQQAMWFLNQLTPNSPVYNIVSSIRINGDLDIPSLERAFQAVVDRHPSLRTTFTISDDGKPIQIIHPHMEVCFQEKDVSNWSENFLQKNLVEEAHRPFNLEQGLLLRINLFTKSAQEHILLLVIHHIVADFWSLTVLANELGILYQVELRNLTDIAPLSRQYTDYAHWQTAMLNSPEGEKLWEYWHHQLAGELPALNLPTDRPRPLIQTYKGASQAFKLGVKLTQKLKALSRTHGATLYTTLLAAFQVLLYRYTGQKDILVGSPTAGRSWAETKGIVGYFVNPVVLRATLSGNLKFNNFLEQVRLTVLDALKHQDYPFALLVEQLQPTRDISRSPLFQVMFVFQKAHLLEEESLSTFALGETGSRLNLGGLELESLALKQRVAQFDLTLMVAESDQELMASFEYNQDLFEAATITRMQEHFQTLLEGIVAEPEQKLLNLPLLTVAERHELLSAWNDTQKDYREELCMQDLIEFQVEKTPDAIAVVFADEHVTYRELNCRSNQLAHYLRKLGVGAETLVGICMERSIEMVVGILAILKAGGAYVPLDPEYPPERLAFMLNDSQVALLLTQQQLVDKLPEHKAKVICVDTNWENIANENLDNPVKVTAGNNLAYVIYTSGSTGKPKGAMNTHSGVRNRLLWMQDKYQLEPADCVLQKTPFSFDVSVWEFLWPLIVGAKLVVARPGGHRDSAYLIDAIANQQITTLHFVPSMLQVFLEEPRIKSCYTLKKVICSGEAMPFELQQRFFECLEAELHNLYGPTEAAIDVTFWECQQDNVLATVPIGRPIANTQIYLLDQYLNPVPVGVPGELHIGGAGLARGYLHRPELTAAKFIPHPFSTQSGARLYKTGDLARYQPDGIIEYLGRLDHQVKIRGFRIELGEIETALRQHPTVADSVVIAREDSPGEKRLVAYIIPGSEQAPSLPQLRHFLKQQLPEYMLPSDIVELKTFPLTPNGKLDRRALPMPDQLRPAQDHHFVAPRNWIEEILADIWAEVLRMEQIGIYDNFFDLGGDSIRSIQVRAKAQKAGLDFSLQQLFQCQTIHELAQVLQIAEPDSLLAPKTEPFSLISDEDYQKLPTGVEDAYPLAMLQEGFVFHSEYGDDYVVYIMSFHLKTRFDLDSLQTALQHLLERHTILRTSFDLTKFSQPLQLVHQTVDVPLYVEDMRHLSPTEQEQKVTAWIEAERKRKFNWTQPPLLQFYVHRRTDDEFQLSTALAMLDGWSTALLHTELFHSYWALLNDKHLTIEPPQKIAYRDFVALEQKAVHSPECQQYWAQKLSDSNNTHLYRWRTNELRSVDSLPIRLSASVPQQVLEGLKKLARAASAPLKNVLLAAHLRVVSLVSGQSDVLTGLLANGRPEGQDGDQIIGLFLNTVPLRLHLSGGTWIDLVQKTFEAERDLLPYRRYPIAELQRTQGRQMKFDTLFNFINFHVYESVGELTDFEVLGIGTKYDQTYFDLATYFDLDVRSSQLQIHLDVNTVDLCDAQIAAIADYYLETLSAMANDPSGYYELQCLLPEREQHQLLVDWNNTEAEYPRHTCIHQLFEAQAELTPNAIAVVFENQQLSYQELNQQANQLAHFLQKQGVAPDVLVGICVERSVKMVIGLLAILKAGGAYVPLDPGHPQERLRLILDNANLSVLLTQRQLAGVLPDYQGQVIYLDSGSQDFVTESSTNLVPKITSDNLAYVIFTSGSTGQPKGVQIPHSAVVNFLHSMRQELELTELDKLLAVTTISFDIAALEIFLPLTLGAQSIIVSREVASDGMKLSKSLATTGATVMQATPATWQMLLGAGWLGSEHLKILCGGEALTKDLADQLQAKSASVCNLYGPTETTIWSTLYQDDCYSGTDGVVSVGRPIANTQIYLLDQHLNPVPVGVPGELHIGGAGLARGYLHRSELTATKFIPHPFSKQPGARLYKTGDLACYQPDGTIEYLGRLDHQVKIRGFRIELGEIETALRQHPTVADSVAIAKEDSSGEKRLIAYIIPGSEQAPSLPQLRHFLKQQLPEYMLPSAIVELDAFPLTPNGKLDRRALPMPDQLRPAQDHHFVAPRDVLELQIAQIWEELLNIHPIGIKDNFFSLGGHSLTAVRLMARIKEKFRQELPLSTLFQGATVENLANTLREQSDVLIPSPLVGIQPHGSKPPFFCVHPVGGNVLCYLDLVRCLDNPDQPFYGLQAPGLNGEQEPFTRIEDMAGYYVDSLRDLQPSGPYFVGGWSFGGVVAFEMAQQLLQQGQQVSLLALLDSRVPSLSHVPLDNDDALMSYFALDLGGLLGLDLPALRDHLHHLEPNQQLDYVLQQARSAGTLPPDAELGQIQYFLQVYQANIHALRNYVPQVYSGQITLFQASDQLNASLDPSMGWSRLAPAGVEIHTIPGNHYTMFQKPHVQFLGERLRTCLLRSSSTAKQDLPLLSNKVV